MVFLCIDSKQFVFPVLNNSRDIFFQIISPGFGYERLSVFGREYQMKIRLGICSCYLIVIYSFNVTVLRTFDAYNVLCTTMITVRCTFCLLHWS